MRAGGLAGFGRYGCLRRELGPVISRAEGPLVSSDDPGAPSSQAMLLTRSCTLSLSALTDAVDCGTVQELRGWGGSGVGGSHGSARKPFLSFSPSTTVIQTRLSPCRTRSS